MQFINKKYKLIYQVNLNNLDCSNMYLHHKLKATEEGKCQPKRKAKIQCCKIQLPSSYHCCFSGPL